MKQALLRYVAPALAATVLIGGTCATGAAATQDTMQAKSESAKNIQQRNDVK